MIQDKTPLWSPSTTFMQQSNMMHYMEWLKKKKHLSFQNYDDLWEWSVSSIADFWESLWEYFSIKTNSPYSSVLEKPNEGMIGTKWFSGATVNYAEHIFRNKTTDSPAIIFQSETKSTQHISWAELEEKVSKVAAWLKSKGIVRGDRVVSLMPNIPETVIAFLAANSIGAVWSSCSPDFGNASITDRFFQIAPKVLFVTDGYTYNGKPFDKISAWQDMVKTLPSVEQMVWVPYLHAENQVSGTVSWTEVLNAPANDIIFDAVPFDHPIWILFSSGTTGKPKAITHSAGGCLLEHLKALVLHQDVKKGEKYFWYSTTGWMMWNFSVASLLAGASLVIYEGSAAYPALETLWQLAKNTGINHFGGGAAFYIACMKAGLHFNAGDFPVLRTIGSTGSPLPAEAFQWIYDSVKKESWLISFSGGTDICSGFVGGCPLLPVYAGEIQCRLLGCYLDAFDEQGNSVREQLGEMVIREPMPSMPIYFWGDENDTRYQNSYFEQYKGIWRHGDWIEISTRGSVIIFGRSDATLNRDGVRIGTSEIYSAVESIPEVADSIIVCIEKEGGQYFMPLFVVMKKGNILDEAMKMKIKARLRNLYSTRHVPDEIFSIDEVPYTISGKKMEAPVKKILMGTDPDKAASRDTMRNPDSLNFFLPFV
ncbi:MAG: acetoacetate--CoA ligase [Chitinophagaceae bacterium]